MFWFYVGPRKLEIKKTDLLVSDSLNVYPCQFQFSQDWNSLIKHAVFKAGDKAIEVLLDATNSCNIPWEVLLKHKLDLLVGCYGTKGEELILNTTWTNVGQIYEGTKDKGTTGENPTPDVTTQILSKIGNLEDLSTENKNDLVSSVNEVNLNLDTKLDVAGGVATGPIMFAETISPIMTYTFEDQPIATVEDVLRGTSISDRGIYKDSDGPLEIHASSALIDFDNGEQPAILMGVVGDKDMPTSVPNMSQIPTKNSQLQNDSDFATKQFVKDSIDNIDISEVGTFDHRELTNRNAQDQHPISAITGLQNILDSIPTPMSAQQLREILSK